MAWTDAAREESLNVRRGTGGASDRPHNVRGGGTASPDTRSGTGINASTAEEHRDAARAHSAAALTSDSESASLHSRAATWHSSAATKLESNTPGAQVTSARARAASVDVQVGNNHGTNASTPENISQSGSPHATVDTTQSQGARMRGTQTPEDQLQPRSTRARAEKLASAALQPLNKSNTDLTNSRNSREGNLTHSMYVRSDAPESVNEVHDRLSAAGFQKVGSEASGGYGKGTDYYEHPAAPNAHIAVQSGYGSYGNGVDSYADHHYASVYSKGGKYKS